MEFRTSGGVVPPHDLQARGAQLQPVESHNAVESEKVEKLAYSLWQYRGAPEGSPEEDWIEAEKQLGTSEASFAATVGSR